MENQVIQMLNDYLTFEQLKEQKHYDHLTWEEKDDLRLANDNDAKYYYEECKLERSESLKADTIISFWTPYCRLLELEADWKVFKTAKSLMALLRQIELSRENDYTEKIIAINKRIEDFAKMCYTKGNYMLLPDRKMNIQRYSIGNDRIDLTLYECFDKGALSKFFPDDEDLHSWIMSEKLDGLFLDGKISKENIKWFVEDRSKLISEMNADEIYKYLENAVLFLKERNK